MKLSRFVGATTRDALRQVREALGEDALIVSNRIVDGSVEIVATLDTPSSLHADEVARQAAGAVPSDPASTATPDYRPPALPKPPASAPPPRVMMRPAMAAAYAAAAAAARQQRTRQQESAGEPEETANPAQPDAGQPAAEQKPEQPATRRSKVRSSD